MVRTHHSAPSLGDGIGIRVGLRSQILRVRVPPEAPNKEAWQSPVYCTCLENRRIERYREFESHRFRHQWRVGREVMQWIANPSFRKRRTGSNPVLSAIKEKI